MELTGYQGHVGGLVSQVNTNLSLANAIITAYWNEYLKLNEQYEGAFMIYVKQTPQ
jgi:hypothetical protein